MVANSTVHSRTGNQRFDIPQPSPAIQKADRSSSDGVRDQSAICLPGPARSDIVFTSEQAKAATVCRRRRLSSRHSSASSIYKRRGQIECERDKT